MLNYLQVLTHFRDKTCWVVKTELANHRYQLELLNLVDLNGKKKYMTISMFVIIKQHIVINT